MAFPFSHNQKKEKFDFTFLNEVSLKIMIPSGLDMIPPESLKDLFKKVFGLELKEMHYKMMLESRLQVSDRDKGLVFNFSKDKVKISIEQSHYSTFTQSLKPIVHTFIEEFKSIQSFCGGVEMKFVDVWPLSDENSMITQDQIRILEEAIFAPEIRGISEKLDKNFKGCELEDDNFNLIIKYGAYASDDADKTSGVALETRCKTKEEKISLSDVEEISSKMNQLLYDAFIWIVTPEILENMRGKAK